MSVPSTMRRHWARIGASLLGAAALALSVLALGAGTAGAATTSSSTGTGPACIPQSFSPPNPPFSCTGPNWPYVQSDHTYNGTLEITNTSSAPITIEGDTITEGYGYEYTCASGTSPCGPSRYGGSVTLSPGQTQGVAVTFSGGTLTPHNGRVPINFVVAGAGSSTPYTFGAFYPYESLSTPPTGTTPICSSTVPSGTAVGMASSQNGGYWIADAAGQVVTCGSATGFGGLTNAPVSPIVAIVATPHAHGYWMVGRNGAVYAFGSAGFYGSVPGLPTSEQPNTPVVGMAATANGKGYWIVTSAGDIYSFGDAVFHGSTGAITLNKPIVGMALDPATGGYWLDATDGGVFAFDAPFYGSMGGTPLNKPVVGMAPDLATGGYWLVAADGGVFSFHAPFYGSTGNIVLNKPIVAMAASPAGTGYRFIATDGGVFDFGSSHFYGSAA